MRIEIVTKFSYLPKVEDEHLLEYHCKIIHINAWSLNAPSRY